MEKVGVQFLCGAEDVLLDSVISPLTLGKQNQTGNTGIRSEDIYMSLRLLARIMAA